jgi:hypothetical protein
MSAIVVLGMHRSGTSCLAGMLIAVGAQAPGTVIRNWDNARGHHEAVDAVRLNEAVLAHSGGHWLQPPATLRWLPEHAAERDRLLAQPHLLLKDPRTLLTLPFWCPPAARLIGIIRHPLAVAHSLLAWRQMPVTEGLALWTAHNRVLLAAHRAHGFPLLDFDAEPEAFLGAVGHAAEQLGLPADPDLLRAAYAEDLVHHAGGECPDAAALALYRELQERCLAAEAPRRAGSTFPWDELTDPTRAAAAIARAADPAAVAVPAVSGLLRAGRAADAVTLLDTVQLPPALGDLLAGKALLALGQADAAVQRLTAACTAAEPYYEARLLLPQALRQAGQFSAANTALSSLLATALYPHGPLSTLAEWAQLDGDNATARQRMAEAIAAAPPRKRGRLRTRLAEWLIAAGDALAAITQLELAGLEDPTWPRSRTLLATLLKR